MRLAYDNILKTSTFTAINENPNYPVVNVYHKWRRKTFKSTVATDVITSVLDYPQKVTCIAISYHNLTSGTATLYDALDAVLTVLTFDCSKATDMQYTDFESVAKIVYSIASISIIEIGELYAGTDLHYSKSAEQDMPLNSSDSATSSSDRQIAGRKGTITRSGTITIPLLTATERDEIEQAFFECGMLQPFFLDLWDLSHNSFIPMYGCFNSNQITVKHEASSDTISFDFQEVN